MRLKKMPISFFLISIVIIFITGVYNISAAFNIPEHIKIGLFFGSNSKTSIQLKSPEGFILTKFNNGQQIVLIPRLYQTDINLRKDAYYYTTDGKSTENIASIDEQKHQFDLKGVYHIQIGGQLDSYEEAKNFIDYISLDLGEIYPVYESGWYVYIGTYITQEITQNRAEEIEEQLGVVTKIIHPSDTRVQIADLTGKPIFVFDSNEDIFLSAFKGEGTPIIMVGEKNYRGKIIVKRNVNSDMTIINKLPLEEYLYGVIPREMSPSWPKEALKAQAVAARSYAVMYIGRHRNLGFDICDTTNSQAYAGYDREHPNTNQAVDETRSKVITYNGKIVQAYYHSNSGGHTENSENVWVNALPYIRAVKDDFSLNALHSTWEQSFTQEDLNKMLQKSNINIGDVLDIKINNTSESGRILSLTIYGTKGQQIIEKERTRTVFGLKSSLFTVERIGTETLFIQNSKQSSPQPISLKGKHIISATKNTKIMDESNINIFNGKIYKKTEGENKEFIFKGKGFGHGLGMSQYGAKAMAELNYNYEQILAHYYTGIKVE